MTAQLIVVSIWAAGKGTMAATHFNYDGSQRAGFAISTMAASQGPKGDENNEKSIANRETEGPFVEKKKL